MAAALGALAVLALQGLCSAADTAADRPDHSFAVLPQRSAVLSAEYWNPILAYVNRRTGLNLKLRLVRTVPEFNAAAAAGEYDFVYSNTIFRPSIAKAAYRVILAPRVESTRGMFAVLTSSTINTLEDVRGLVVGFPSTGAFVAYAVTRDQLARRGISVTEVFGGNQEGVMAQLAAGSVAAISVNSQLLYAYAQRTGLSYRVLWQSQPFANLPVAAHPRVPPEAAKAVTAALAGMIEDTEGAAVLAACSQAVGLSPPYGFREALPEDYQAYTDFYRDTALEELK